MTTPISAIKTKPRDVCPVCGHEGSTLYKDMKDYFLSTPGLWTINKCSNNSCSTLWLNPMPLEEEIWKAYQTYHTHSNAIEHLYDPLESIKRCHQLLKKGGKLIVTTPNGNSLSHQRYGEYWRGLEPPRHIQIFTPNSLSNVVEQAGFSNRVVKTLSTGAAGIYKVSALASKKKSFFMKTLRTIESIFLELVEQHRNDIGQDILIIATKE
jgi:SAM-dependent methyltransferase